MKKYILITLAVFGFSALAGMSGMAGQGDDAEGFNGSVELKWRHGGDWGNFSYRARAGWTGSVNDAIQWGVAWTTPIEGAPVAEGDEAVTFSTYSVGAVNLEQAYVKYSPVESFYIKAGKYEYYSNFNKYGVLVDDDLYAEGAKAKFKYEVAPAIHIYAKASVEQTGEYAGIWADQGGVAGGWIGVHSDGDWKYGVGAGIQTNQFPGSGDKTLVSAKASFGSDDVAGMPAGVFGFWSSNADAVGAGTYSVGVHVGDTSEANGWGVAVNYYNVTEADWNTAIVDTDYIAGAGAGVAVKAQYNPWDNTNVAVKYNWADSDDSSHGFVGELTFNF